MGDIFVGCELDDVQGRIGRVLGKVEMEGKSGVGEGSAEECDKMGGERGKVKTERLGYAKCVIKRGR